MIEDIIIGQESSATIKMSNQGGLGTKFDIIIPSKSNYYRANHNQKYENGSVLSLESKNFGDSQNSLVKEPMT